MKAAAQQRQRLDGLKDIRELLEQRGMKRDHKTVSKYCRDGKDPLPAYKARGRIYAYSDEVDAWIARQHSPLCVRSRNH